MKQCTETFAETYAICCAHLQDEFAAQGRHDLCEGFMARWQKAHAHLICNFETNSQGAHLEEKWELLSTNLLQLRNRMSSALAQGLRIDPERAHLSARMQQYLLEHDKCFNRIIQNQYENLQRELNEIRCARHAIGAYARSARQMGDSSLW